MKSVPASLALLFLLAACGGGGGSPGVTSNAIVSAAPPAPPAPAAIAPVGVFTATLTGAQESPPAATAASGTGTLVIDPNSRLLRATIVTSGLRGTSAGIRQAAPGINGPLIVPMTETTVGSGIWIAVAALTDAQLASLDAGNHYFNVQSAAFPNGEIRGQIVPQLVQSGVAASGTAPVAVTTLLTGAQEAPPNASSAVAAGTALIEPAARTLTVAVTTFGIAATAVRVHEAPPGQNGTAVFALAETSPASGIWMSRVTLGNAALTSALAGNFYFQVASTAFPNGEVRAQIAPPGGFRPAVPATSTPVATPLGVGSGAGIGSIDIGTVTGAGTSSGIGTTTGTTPIGGVGSSSGIGSMDIGSVTGAGVASGIGTGTGTGSAVGVGTSSGIGTTDPGRITGAGIASGIGTGSSTGGVGGVISTGSNAGIGTTGIATTAGF